MSNARQLTLFEEALPPTPLPAAQPRIYERVAAAVDPSAADKLAEMIGGDRVYVPAMPTESHWLCEAFGAEMGRRIAEAITQGQGGTFDFPLGANDPNRARREQIFALLDEGGYGTNELVRMTRYSRRSIVRWKQVWRDRQKARHAEAQRQDAAGGAKRP